MKNSFRVWCRNNREWEKDSVAILPDGSVYDIRHRMVLRPENHIVSTYTNRNVAGVPLYEGDIVCLEVLNNFDEPYGYKIYLRAIFHDHAFMYGTIKEEIPDGERSVLQEGTLFPIDYFDEADCFCNHKIIGNIYENSELFASA